MASTCFEHYLLILRRRFTNGTWYIACVLCQMAAPILMQPTDIKSMQYSYHVSLVQRLLRMSK
jgi:hypothetical protein